MRPALVGIAAVTVCIASNCGYDDVEEMERESAVIEARAPRGTPFAELPAAMAALGYQCSEGRREFMAGSPPRQAEAHLTCEREQPYALVCTKRVRAILLPLHGQLAGVLVNAGLFCS